MTGGTVPVPTPETEPFWAGTLAGELRVQRCNNCGRHYFYPRPFCPTCWSDDVAWKEASGRGTLYTYSIVHVNDLPPFAERVPYVAAVVELDEGPRVMTNVEGVAFEDLRVEMPVVVDFKAISDDITIPVFRAAP